MVIPVGPELDAAVCKHVFGMSDEKIARLITTKRLPRYSRSYRRANALHHHFRMTGGDAYQRFDRELERYIPDDVGPGRQWARAAIICSVPSTVCDAALRAVGYAPSDQI
jgi:hypothetical protein